MLLNGQHEDGGKQEDAAKEHESGEAEGCRGLGGGAAEGPT